MSVFLPVSEEEVRYRDPLFFIIRDRYPVSPGHLLIISCTERIDYFALTPAEQEHIPQLLAQTSYGARVSTYWLHYWDELRVRSGANRPTFSLPSHSSVYGRYGRPSWQHSTLRRGQRILLTL